MFYTSRLALVLSEFLGWKFFFFFYKAPTLNFTTSAQAFSYPTEFRADSIRVASTIFLHSFFNLACTPALFKLGSHLFKAVLTSSIHLMIGWSFFHLHSLACFLSTDLNPFFQYDQITLECSYDLHMTPLFSPLCFFIPNFFLFPIFCINYWFS